MREAAAISEGVGLKLVTFHAGFISADPSEPAFEKGIKRISELADLFKNHGVEIALETGQESADTLLRFLAGIGRSDVGVNFDPGKMILYGSGDPVAALKLFLPHLKQIHGKDAISSEWPGTVWGKEVPIGAGQVNWSALLSRACTPAIHRRPCD